MAIMKSGFLHINGGNLKLTNCIISNNTSNEGAIMGILDNFLSNIEILNCSFYDNFGYSSLFDIYNGQITIENSIFDENSNNLFIISFGEIKLKNIEVLNHYCDNLISGCILMSKDYSKFSSIDLKINYLKHLNMDAGIYIENSDLKMIKSSFNNIGNIKNIGSCIYSIMSNIIIEENEFLNYDYNCIYSLNSNNIIKNSIFSNEFYNEKKNLENDKKPYGAIYCLGCQSFQISNSSISYNKDVLNGAGISLINLNIIRNLNDYIINCNLTHNMVNLNGGGIYFFNSKIKILNSNFIENNAEKGGAIFYDLPQSIII